MKETDNISIKENILEADDFNFDEYNFVPTEIEIDGKKITDYTEIEHDRIFLVNKKNILNEKKPKWIPEFDSETLEWNKFLPVCIKDPADGNFFVMEKIYHGPVLTPYKQRKEKDFETKIYRLSLDLLTASIDYYIKKRNAELKQKGQKKRVSLPHSQNSMALSRYNEMAVLLSFCSTYKDRPDLFNVNLRKSSSAYKEQNKIIFIEQWQPLLEAVKGKKLDMNLQKQDYINSFAKAEETAYGKSGRTSIFKEKYGIMIKKQNGSTFSSEQKNNLENTVMNVWEHFGSLTEMALKNDLTVSYADNCCQFARKASGLFRTDADGNKAIGISFFTDRRKSVDNPESTLAHECTHWLDSEKGNNSHHFYASDLEGTLENQIAMKYKKLLKKENYKLSDYWYRTCECLARASEQYYEITHGINQGLKREGYLSEDICKNEIFPLMEMLIEENKSIFNLQPFVKLQEKNDSFNYINESYDEKINEIKETLKILDGNPNPQTFKLSLQYQQQLDELEKAKKEALDKNIKKTSAAQSSENISSDKFQNIIIWPKNNIFTNGPDFKIPRYGKLFKEENGIVTYQYAVSTEKNNNNSLSLITENAEKKDCYFSINEMKEDFNKRNSDELIKLKSRLENYFLTEIQSLLKNLIIEKKEYENEHKYDGLSEEKLTARLNVLQKRLSVYKSKDIELTLNSAGNWGDGMRKSKLPSNKAWDNNRQKIKETENEILKIKNIIENLSENNENSQSAENKNKSNLKSEDIQKELEKTMNDTKKNEIIEINGKNYLSREIEINGEILCLAEEKFNEDYNALTPEQPFYQEMTAVDEKIYAFIPGHFFDGNNESIINFLKYHGYELPEKENFDEKLKKAEKDSQYLHEIYGNEKTIDSAVKKASIKDFVCTDPTKYSMTGIYYEDGFAVATNGRILIKQKMDYPAEYEGKIIDPNTGKEIEGKFPAYKKVFPEKEDLIDRSHRLADISKYLSTATTAKNISPKNNFIPVVFENTVVASNCLQTALSFVRDKGFNKIYQSKNFEITYDPVLDSNNKITYGYYNSDEKNEDINYKHKYYTYDELPEDVKKEEEKLKAEADYNPSEYHHIRMQNGTWWHYDVCEKRTKKIIESPHILLNRAIEFDHPDGSSILIMPLSNIPEQEIYFDDKGILKNYSEDTEIKIKLLGKDDDFFRNGLSAVCPNASTDEIARLYEINLATASSKQNKITFPQTKKDCQLYAQTLTYADIVMNDIQKDGFNFSDSSGENKCREYLYDKAIEFFKLCIKKPYHLFMADYNYDKNLTENWLKGEKLLAENKEKNISENSEKNYVQLSDEEFDVLSDFAENQKMDWFFENTYENNNISLQDLEDLAADYYSSSLSMMNENEILVLTDVFKKNNIDIPEIKIVGSTDELKKYCHRYYIKDSAEFEVYADFEPILNLTAEEALLKLKELHDKGYNPEIGITVLGSIDHDVEFEGEGVGEVGYLDDKLCFANIFDDKSHMESPMHKNYRLALLDLSIAAQKLGIKIENEHSSIQLINHSEQSLIDSLCNMLLTDTGKNFVIPKDCYNNKISSESKEQAPEKKTENKTSLSDKLLAASEKVLESMDNFYEKLYEDMTEQGKEIQRTNMYYFDECSKNNSLFTEYISNLCKMRKDFFTSDRECAAVMLALKENELLKDLNLDETKIKSYEKEDAGFKNIYENTTLKYFIVDSIKTCFAQLDGGTIKEIELKLNENLDDQNWGKKEFAAYSHFMKEIEKSIDSSSDSFNNSGEILKDFFNKYIKDVDATNSLDMFNKTISNMRETVGNEKLLAEYAEKTVNELMNDTRKKNYPAYEMVFHHKLNDTYFEIKYEQEIDFEGGHFTVIQYDEEKKPVQDLTENNNFWGKTPSEIIKSIFRNYDGFSIDDVELVSPSVIKELHDNIKLNMKDAENIIKNPVSVELENDSIKSDDVAILFNYDIKKSDLPKLFYVDEHHDKHLSDKDENLNVQFKIHQGTINDITLTAAKDNKSYNFNLWNNLSVQCKKNYLELMNDKFKSINNGIAFDHEGWNAEWNKIRQKSKKAAVNIDEFREKLSEAFKDMSDDISRKYSNLNAETGKENELFGIKPFEIYKNDEKGRLNIKMNSSFENIYFRQIIKELHENGWKYASSKKQWYPVNPENSEKFAFELHKKYSELLTENLMNKKGLKSVNQNTNNILKKDTVMYFDYYHDEPREFQNYFTRMYSPISMEEASAILKAINNFDMEAQHKKTTSLGLNENKELSIITQNFPENTVKTVTASELITTAINFASKNLVTARETVKKYREQNNFNSTKEIQDIFLTAYEDCLKDVSKTYTVLDELYLRFNPEKEIKQDEPDLTKIVNPYFNILTYEQKLAVWKDMKINADFKGEYWDENHEKIDNNWNDPWHVTIPDEWLIEKVNKNLVFPVEYPYFDLSREGQLKHYLNDVFRDDNIPYDEEKIRKDLKNIDLMAPQYWIIDLHNNRFLNTDAKKFIKSELNVISLLQEKISSSNDKAENYKETITMNTKKNYVKDLLDKLNPEDRNSIISDLKKEKELKDNQINSAQKKRKNIDDIERGR